MKEIKDVIEEQEGIDLENFELIEDEEEVKRLNIEELKKSGKIRLHGEDLFEITIEESQADDVNDFEVVDD